MAQYSDWNDDNLESEERDTIPAYIVRTCEHSPKHRSSVDAVYPRMIVDDISPTGSFHPLHWPGHKRSDRRMSDPGRLSISPIRKASHKIGSCLSEQCIKTDTIVEEGSSMSHPRLKELRSSIVLEDECYMAPSLPICVSPGRSRARDKPTGHPSSLFGIRRAQRSMSLPTSESVVLEVGEAIGALAVQSPTNVEVTPHPQLRRRRSISMEPTFLEAIAEEGGAWRGNRRYSTSNLQS